MSQDLVDSIRAVFYKLDQSDLSALYKRSILAFMEGILNDQHGNRDLTKHWNAPEI